MGAEDFHSALVGCCEHSDIAVTAGPINIPGDGWLEGEMELDSTHSAP